MGDKGRFLSTGSMRGLRALEGVRERAWLRRISLKKMNSIKLKTYDAPSLILIYI